MRNIIKYAIFLKFSRNVLFDKIFRPFDIRLDFQLNQYILHWQAPQLMPFINQKSLPATVLIINSLLTKRSTNSTKLRKSLSRTHTEDEWRREGGVRNWSFGLHCIMACEAPAPTWVYCKSYSSWHKSVHNSLSFSPICITHLRIVYKDISLSQLCKSLKFPKSSSLSLSLSLSQVFILFS